MSAILPVVNLDVLRVTAELQNNWFSHTGAGDNQNAMYMCCLYFILHV
jgi:hypothetical protein